MGNQSGISTNRGHAGDPSTKTPPKGAYIPVQFLLEFLEFLHARPERFRIITYDDLAFGSDWDWENQYPNEFRNWRKTGGESPEVAHVLLQHDLDSSPQRAWPIIEREMELGIPSNIMVFNRRYDRKVLKTEGILSQTEYPLDDELLKRAQSVGFVVGYHTNAVEQSLGDLSLAENRFLDDVTALRERFRVRYFSPHGGVPQQGGVNNHDIRVTSREKVGLRWVHNRFGPRFHGNYSDGGINNPQRPLAERDLRKFVRSMKPGRRYRILTHPQYYDVRSRIAPHFAGVAWLKECHAAAESGRPMWAKSEMDSWVGSA